MKKEKYLEPEMDIELLCGEVIITASGDDADDNTGGGDGEDEDDF